MHAAIRELDVKARIIIDVTDVPDTKLIHHRNTIVEPSVVELGYTYRTETGADGWTTHVWLCRSAKVAGFRVLKPGPDGERRIGKVMASSEWTGPFNKDMAVHGSLFGPIPEWLAVLIDQARPDGEVRA